VSGVPCTPKTDQVGPITNGFQFTFVSGVPCTVGFVPVVHRGPPRVSIHLREWGAMHQTMFRSRNILTWFQFTFVSGVPCTSSPVAGSNSGVLFQFTFVSGVPCTPATGSSVPLVRFNSPS